MQKIRGFQLLVLLNPEMECLLWLHINCLLLPVRLISSLPQVTALISCSLLGLANHFSFLNFDVLSALCGNFQTVLSSTPRR